MSDGKLNEKLHGAVRKGGSKAAEGIRHAVHNMRLWQKALLVLCLVCWIASVILGAVCRRITGGMADQNVARRWDPDGANAHISAYLADGSGASDETAIAMQTGLMQDLQAQAIALSDQQIENGAKLINTCYCGVGQAELSVSEEQVSVTALGVGGDFFNFHPLDLVAGFYFSENELMQDRILLDDNTAWRLFGSPYVVGMSVTIGGTPHYIAGVFRRPEGKFYNQAGMGDFLIFMSYDSLCRYTEAGAPASGMDGGSSEDDGSDMMDARAIPRTAAYMPAEMVSLSPAGEEAAAEEPDGSSEAEADDDSGEETEESEESEDADRPANGESMGNGSGYRDGNTGDSGESEEREEVNRNRLTCFEVILPNPVSGFAVSKVRGRLEQLGFGQEQMTVVDNTHRFETLRLVSLLAQPGVRSMQTAAIRYPYWENVALGWEDILIPYALLWMILRYAPLLFLLILVLWYATHKSWTLGGIVKKMSDRIYDRQSEKLYGKPAAAGLPDRGTEEVPELADGSAEETPGRPDGSADEVTEDAPGRPDGSAEEVPENAPELADGSAEETPGRLDGSDLTQA